MCDDSEFVLYRSESNQIEIASRLSILICCTKSVTDPFFFITTLILGWYAIDGV